MPLLPHDKQQTSCSIFHAISERIYVTENRAVSDFQRTKKCPETEKLCPEMDDSQGVNAEVAGFGLVSQKNRRTEDWRLKD